MVKKIIGTIAFLFYLFVGIAQDSSQKTELERGDIMVSVNFGVGSYIGGWKTPIPNQSSYTLSAPMENWFDKKPMLDIEGRYFVTDKWAVKASTGLAYSYNPGYSEVTGTVNGLGFIDTDDVEIPTYNAVPNSSNIQLSLTLGGDYYWKLKNKLFLRAGGELNYAYGRAKAIGRDSESYMGTAIAEAFAFRIAPVAGLDYFVNNILFLGVDVRPVSYQYAVYNERPQVGLGLLSSDNHTISFIAQPMIKLGFIF